MRPRRVGRISAVVSAGPVCGIDRTAVLSILPVRVARINYGADAAALRMVRLM